MASNIMDAEERRAKVRLWGRQAYARLKDDPIRLERRKKKHQQWLDGRSEEKIIADRDRAAENMRCSRKRRGIGPRKPKKTREEINARKRREYAARKAVNPEAFSQRERERHKAWQNPEYRHQRYLLNGEALRKSRNQRERDRAAQNPGFRIARNLRRRLRYALRQNPKQNHSAVRYLGCSIADLREHLENLWTLGMSWENYGPRGWHIDHIRPLATFDLSDSQQILQACHYSNLQPMWATDNHKKGARC